MSESKVESSKVYKLDLEDRVIVDKEFDQLHCEDKLKWTSQITSYEYSVFVMWPNIHEVCKERVVVNIRDLNKISKFDAYSMSLQEDVTSTVHECQFISVMNCVSFFHQWLIKVFDRHTLIVVSHRESER